MTKYVAFSLIWLEVLGGCSESKRDFGDPPEAGGAAGSSGSTAGASGAEAGSHASSTGGSGASGGEAGSSPEPGEGGTVGDGGQSGSGTSSGGEGGQPERCTTEGCCVAGEPYETGDLNPANACQVCQPSESTDSFVSTAESTACGTGCVCRKGKGTETDCADKVDNDGDGDKNCTDLDCKDRTCAAKTVKVFPTADVENTTGQVNQTIGDSVTVRVGASPSTSTSSTFTFGTVPLDPALQVSKAVLRVFTSGPTSIASFKVYGANNISYGEVTVPSGEGYRELNITSLVSQWTSKNVETPSVKLSWTGEIPGSVTIRASEYTGTDTDPYLELTYTSYCTADLQCPEP